MRILITGSRDWSNPGTVHRAVRNAVAFVDGPHVVVQGDCPTGADKIAKDYAEMQDNLTHEDHPADWVRLKKRAGYVRNSTMVNLGADVCLAFIKVCTRQECVQQGRPPHGSHGTQMTIDLAKKAGIPVTIFKEGW